MAAVRGFSLVNIKKVYVSFSVFDGRVGAAREMLRNVSCKGMRSSNPSCKVTSNIAGDYSDPFVEVTFTDGTIKRFDTTKIKTMDMIAEINTKRKSLQQQ